MLVYVSVGKTVLWRWGIGDGPGQAEDSLLLAVLSHERAHKASGQGVTRNSGRVRIMPWYVPQQPFLGTALLSLLSGRSATDYGRCTGSAVCCAVVFSSLLYCYESLCLHRRQQHKLEQFRTRCNKCIAVCKVATPLRELTCHMESHKVLPATRQR